MCSVKYKLADVAWIQCATVQDYGDKGAKLVITNGPERPYFHLTDYRVTSAVSGPGFVLVPR